MLIGDRRRLLGNEAAIGRVGVIVARILIVGNLLSPLVRERGLVGREAGHEIYGFCPTPVDWPGAVAFSAPARLPGWRSFYIWAALRAVLARVRPHLVHVHYAAQGMAQTLALVRYRPLIVTVMGGDVLPDQDLTPWRAIWARWLLGHADRITSKSGFLDRALMALGGRASTIRRITWGVDVDLFRPATDTAALRHHWHIPADEVVFFDPRLARPLYNKHVILEAFAEYLRHGGRPATLLVAELMAEASYAELLRRRAAELGIADRVRFVGSVPRAQMPAYYALAEVTLSVPASDGLPQTIYEAWACGSFLILSDLPQYADLIEPGVMAQVVPAGNSMALAAAMRWAADNDDVRRQAAVRGRAYVEAYADCRTQSALMNQIYAEQLARYQR